ncbi:Nramp family divalent metal transporter [Mammaliicoccus sp. Dog046]|uniref:Nramp family divalent metal transporter n=1 Tax=Mammaliicoccus sp. Dog046 TaxID=3034233 RepID=UPI002B263747|nr:Nramp family divalent metal transporter [Mammaliicoccus sp. Dog046]WQK85222.1 Nramp family divalent metal transporter [Mammaliicoccus sp. Dog046]
MENVKRLNFIKLIQRIGPGIVLTGVVIGPGVITTASMVGASYGYSLLWLFIPIAFMGVTFVIASYRITLLTGMPSIKAIRHYFGRPASILVGVSTFLSCVFFTIGNISGTGAAMNLLFGIDWKIGAIIMLLVLIYCYFSKNVYTKVEKLILLCIFGMIIAFYISLASVGGPDVKLMTSGLTHWQLPGGSLLLALGFISTHASITTGIYGTYLSKEKKWSKDDLYNGGMLADALAHVVGVIIVSGAIVLVGAIVLHPYNLSITSPTQLSDLLKPFLGHRFAPIVMGVALLAAAFSSLLGNTHRSVVLLNAGFDKPTNLDHKSIQIGAVIVLIISSIISFSYGGSPIELIYISNIATSIATPVAGLFMTILLLKKDVNKGEKRPYLLQIAMVISYIFCVGLIVASVINMF